MLKIEERIIPTLPQPIIVLTLTGKITSGYNANQLWAKVLELLANDRTRIILDLAQVSYVDSIGVKRLVNSYSETKNRGGRLVLLNPTKKVHDLLAILKLLTVFACYETERAAIDSFGGQEAQA